SAVQCTELVDEWIENIPPASLACHGDCAALGAPAVFGGSAIDERAPRKRSLASAKSAAKAAGGGRKPKSEGGHQRLDGRPCRGTSGRRADPACLGGGEGWRRPGHIATP